MAKSRARVKTGGSVKHGGLEHTSVVSSLVYSCMLCSILAFPSTDREREYFSSSADYCCTAVPTLRRQTSFQRIVMLDAISFNMPGIEG